jgi:antitoxin ChpS
MHTTSLRKVGGSVMMIVPPAFLDQLHLQPGATVGVVIENGRLIVEPKRARYTLDELLAQCDLDAPLSEAEREWIDAPAFGLEILPGDSTGDKA